MLESNKAWMAGFVDGEGYLGIAKQVRKGRPSPRYWADIAISNTNREVLVPFMNEYGGKIYVHYENRMDARGVKWSDAFAWSHPVS